MSPGLLFPLGQGRAATQAQLETSAVATSRTPDEARLAISPSPT